MKAIPLNGDNQGAIFMASNPVQEKRIKHMDIRYHFIRQVVKKGKVVLYYIEGDKNPTDMLLRFDGPFGPQWFSRVEVATRRWLQLP